MPCLMIPTNPLLQGANAATETCIMRQPDSSVRLSIFMMNARRPLIFPFLLLTVARR